MSLLRGVSFDHLRATRRRKYTLDGVYVRSDKEVVLELQYIGNDSRIGNAFRKADAALTSDSPGRARFNAVLSVFAECAVVGWENVVGADGAPVALYVDGVIEIMRALGDAALDKAIDAVNYSMHADNFRDFTPPKVDVESLGKG